MSAISSTDSVVAVDAVNLGFVGSISEAFAH